MAPVFQSTDAGSGSDAMASSAVAVAAFAPTCVEHRGRSTRSERPQTRKRNHPRPRLMDTSRVDGVKASLHNGTPGSHDHVDLEVLVFRFKELLLVGVSP